MRDIQSGCEMSSKCSATEEIHARGNAINSQSRSQLAFSYLGYGDMYFGVAERAESILERQDNLTCARSWFQKSLDIWRDMKRSGILRAVDSQYPDQVSQKILKCNEALSQLNTHYVPYSGISN